MKDTVDAVVRLLRANGPMRYSAIVSALGIEGLAVSKAIRSEYGQKYLTYCKGYGIELETPPELMICLVE